MKGTVRRVSMGQCPSEDDEARSTFGNRGLCRKSLNRG